MAHLAAYPLPSQRPAAHADERTRTHQALGRTSAGIGGLSRTGCRGFEDRGHHRMPRTLEVVPEWICEECIGGERRPIERLSLNVTAAATALDCSKFPSGTIGSTTGNRSTRGTRRLTLWP